MEHTKGPWKAVGPSPRGAHDAGDYAIVDEHDAIIAEAFVLVGKDNVRPAKANAAVIAAAPTMLEALEHPTYGDLFDLATEINDALEEGTAPRIGQIGALFDMGRRQRAAIKQARSNSIDPDYENAEAQREAN